MMEIKKETLHGRTVSYAEAGTGPVLLLIHGMGGSFENWRAVIEPLARSHTVIVPNLPGHGGSSPGGDYSVGGLAAGLRDLLLVLGHDRATLVGHSLGGGIAMQFAYQFPEIVERLVLVSSGGLGPEVSLLLRAAALPGAGPFIAATASAVRTLEGGLRRAEGLGLRPSTDVTEVVHGYGLLADPERRAGFLATVRSVIDIRGQRVSAVDRLYLAEAVPVLIVWGARDRLVPAVHAEHAQRGIPGSRLEVFEEAGHLPQLE
jgi:pimeloyl-ACP methyl ester carboxylesterase